MAGSVRKEIWVQKDIIEGQKYVSLIPFFIFWVVWKEKNWRVFEGVEDDFDKTRDKWL